MCMYIASVFAYVYIWVLYGFFKGFMGYLGIVFKKEYV